MIKAYLRYEQVAGFGVVVSNDVPAQQVGSEGHAPLIACAAVDVLIIWNLRTAEAVARFGNEDTRKAGSISSLAVSSSGEYIACGYTDGSIRLWRFRSGSETGTLTSPFSDSPPVPSAVFNGHRSAVSALSFESFSTLSDGIKQSLDTDLVSGSNDGDVILWSITDGSGKFRLSAHTDAVTSLLLFRRATSSTLYIISASKDALVKVYDADAQHCVQTIAHHRSEVWAMQFDPTLSLLFTGGDGADVRVYNFIDKEKSVSTSPEPSTDSGLAPVDDLLSYSSENILNPLGYVNRKVVTNRISSIESTSHAGERYVIVSASDKNAEVFRCRDFSQAEGHRKRRRNRKLAAIEKEVSDLAEDESWDVSKKVAELEERKRDLDFSLNADDFLISVRLLKMRKKIRSITFLSGRTYIPVDSKIGIQLQLLVQQRDNTLEVHSLTLKSSKKKQKIQTSLSTQLIGADQDFEEEIRKLLTLDFPGHRNDIRSISLSPDETTVFSTSDGALKLWNVATEKCIRKMRFTGYGQCTHFLGADGAVGVVGTKEGEIQVFELGSGSLITGEKAHDGGVRSLCLNDHIYEASSLISGGADKRVCFWGFSNVLVGKSGKLELTRVLEMPDEVLCVKVAYGRERPVLLVAMMDATVRAYFLDNLEPYLSFYGHNLPVMCMDVSSDGLLLATGSVDKTVKLWGMDFGDCRRSLRAHSDSVLCAAFQHKTHYLFTGSKDGSVKYWDGDKFELICELEGQRGEVWSMAVSTDGEIIATASRDRMMRVWRRTDEPLYLDEEKDKRMEDLFESKLIEKDILEASKAKKDNVGFMENATMGESSAAGKRSMDTVKGGEKLLEAIQLCDEEHARLAGESTEGPNPLLLGLSPESYILRTLESIRSADLEEALHILPLDAAMKLLELIATLLSLDSKRCRLSVEMLTRGALFLIKLHHRQVSAGAIRRSVISDLYSLMRNQIRSVRGRIGFNTAALQFWEQELGNRDIRPFQDASARAFNMEHERIQKSKQALEKFRMENRNADEDNDEDDVD